MLSIRAIKVTCLAGLGLLLAVAGGLRAERHPVTREHPRLFGSVGHLRELAAQRHEAFIRMDETALEAQGGDQEYLFSAALAAAVTADTDLARAAVERALKLVRGSIRVGHQTFGIDLANCAVVFDYCRAAWSDSEAAEFIGYVNRTVDANTGSELSVFHNGFYSYKNAGIAVACYATYYENPRAPEILADLEKEIRERVLPSWRLCGDGGGWAEGYYVHYWTLQWLIYCDIARRLEGLDWFAESPEFLGQRAVASMFECYPGIGERGTRHLVPMGDSGGRIYLWERDHELTCRRILAARFRDDPSHRAVAAFDRGTPTLGQPLYAFMDFLWNDTTIAPGDLDSFKLSHLSRGPGFVYARSSWQEDATYFFFKCGPRFTSHQHLDAGHFDIYRGGELAGDGGQFYGFSTDHEVNYLCRSIAHSTLLVKDPAETWPHIRAYAGAMSNDGGQHHDWPHHNGAVQDAADFLAHPDLYDTSRLLAFEDKGDWLYTAGDCSRAYRRSKLEYFTRQIVFLRPGTFVIFDRVKSTKPEYAKTWLLQAMKLPASLADGRLVVDNGKGRLFVQSCLPAGARVNLVSGDALYRIDGVTHVPLHDVGPAPECRVEVSPSRAAREDCFLHVLTATDSGVEDVPAAVVEETKKEVRVRIGDTSVTFEKAKVGGAVEIKGKSTPLADGIVD